MRPISLLPVAALAACGAGDANTNSQDEAPYATQLEAPAPDYGAIIAEARRIEIPDMRRGASAAPPSDAKELGELWLERLEGIGVVDGFGIAGTEANGAITSFHLLMTASEFDAWLADNGWTAPRHISWQFVPELRVPRVSEEAADGIRIWPASERRTGSQHQAAAAGRIFLRDGCFYLDSEGSETLAWFHTETGLDVDEQGYYVLVNRITGQIEGRLGEVFLWEAPNPITAGGPALEDFRAACGEGVIRSVANPTSQAKIAIMYPQRAPDAAPPPDIH